MVETNRYSHEILISSYSHNQENILKSHVFTNFWSETLLINQTRVFRMVLSPENCKGQRNPIGHYDPYPFYQFEPKGTMNLFSVTRLNNQTLNRNPKHLNFPFD